MMYISLELLIQALKEMGLEETFEALDRLFYEEPVIAVIDMDGKVVVKLFDPDEVLETLEYLQEKFVNNIGDEEDM